MPGDIVAGKYRVERVLGRGGMGVVVEATNCQLGDRVALKVLHARHAHNEEALARFHHEARTAVRIRGEHSVRLYDVGIAESGVPFLVMELLEGTDLATLIKAGPVPIEDAVLYILQACEGMAEVHANGIVHRDLKPANLFLGRLPDGRPLVKVLDFGIAKIAMNEADDQQHALTQTLVALGTPLYMSPEQVRSSRHVDGRTDIWSLGAILFELVSGRPAFAGNSVTNITAQVLEANPPALSALRPGAPKGLEQVVRKALSKRPDGRYTDMAAFAAALVPFATPEARIHAERAQQIRDAAGAPAFAPSPDTSPMLGGETLMQTELFTTHRFARNRSRAGFVAGAAIGVLLASATTVVGFRQLRGVSAIASRGVAAAAALEAAPIVAAARVASQAPPVPTTSPEASGAATAKPTSRSPAPDRPRGKRSAATAPVRIDPKGDSTSVDDLLDTRKPGPARR